MSFLVVVVLMALVLLAGATFWQARQERRAASQLLEANRMNHTQMNELATGILKLNQQLSTPVIRLDTHVAETSSLFREADPDQPFYQRAKQLVMGEGYGSASMLRAGLGVGYGRARRLIHRFEKEGILGKAANSHGRRQVIGFDQAGAMQ